MSPLELPVAGLVLIAALLHASWNALTKAGSDRLLSLTVIICTGGVLGAPLALRHGLPEPAVIPWLAGSVTLHTGYHFFLLRMYRFGDLSQTYPIARGIAPLLVGGLSAGLAGETLAPIQIGGLCFACGSIASLALGRGSGVGDARRAALAAVGTGAFIGAYSFVDGMGVRAAGAPSHFIVWMFVLDTVPIVAAALWLRGGAQIRAWLRSREAGRAALGGAIATGAYAIVLWAMDQGAMAHVSALRETSVIFAALIGTRLLGEPFGARRIAAACGVAAGVVLLHAA